MTNATLFNQFLIWPFINLLVAFYKGFSFLHIPGSLGFAIIALTLTVRGALHPLTAKQMESAKKMQELKPHLDKLQHKHKHDKQRLQQEQLKLYQKHGLNPAAGCLPMLLQFPVLIALYQVFWQILGNSNLSEMVSQINNIVYFSYLKIQSLDLWFFGINLASKPSQWQEHGWWLLGIPIITAGLQWYQTKLMTNIQRTEDRRQKTVGGRQKTEEEKEQKENLGQEMQKQMAILMPLMIGFFAFSFPIGLALYWNTFTVFGIISQKKNT